MDYSEEQKIQNAFALITFFVSAIIAFAGTSYALYAAWQEGQSMTQIFWLPIFIIAVEGLAYYVVFQTILEMYVGSDGFSYRYAPFVRKKKTIPFSDIVSWKIRTIKNLREFGGLGYRKSFRWKKTGYVMGSHDGLELTLQNDKVYVFSTANPYILASALKKYMPQKEIVG